MTFFSFHLNWPKKPSSPPSSCCCSINMKIFIWTIACLLPVIVSHSFAIATSHPIALIEYLETNQQPSIDEKWKHIEFILWRDVAFDVDVAAAVLCTISNKHLTTNNNSHTNTRKKLLWNNETISERILKCRRHHRRLSIDEEYHEKMQMFSLVSALVWSTQHLVDQSKSSMDG